MLSRAKARKNERMNDIPLTWYEFTIDEIVMDVDRHLQHANNIISDMQAVRTLLASTSKGGKSCPLCSWQMNDVAQLLKIGNLMYGCVSYLSVNHHANQDPECPRVPFGWECSNPDCRTIQSSPPRNEARMWTRDDVLSHRSKALAVLIFDNFASAQAVAYDYSGWMIKIDGDWYATPMTRTEIIDLLGL